MKKEIVSLEHKAVNFDHEVKIEWHIGLFCNHNCSYCTEESHSNKQDFLDYDKFKRGVQNLKAKIDTEKIRIEFTGGEPTLHPRFLDMLKYVKESGITKVSFTTNGHKTFEYYKVCIDLIDSITFSYHMEYNDFKPEMIIGLQNYINGKKRKRWLKVHIMFLPTTLIKVKQIKHIFKENNIRYVVRRVRPSYQKNHPSNEYWKDGTLKKGVFVKPYDNKTISVLLKTENSGTDHSEGDGVYYNDEEIKFMQNETRFNFENLIIHYSDVTSEKSNINEITGKKLNRFRGWKCWAGIQAMRIGIDGAVTVGKCEIPSLGNVFDKFKIPTQPSICKNDWCCSATNINTSKIKSDVYFSSLRIGKK